MAESHSVENVDITSAASSEQLNESLKKLTLTGAKKKKNFKKSSKSSGHPTPAGESANGGFSPKNKTFGLASKIPRPLSTSDPSGSTWALRGPDCPYHSPPSSTSQHSFSNRTFYNKKGRRLSDTQSDQGYRMSQALRVHTPSSKSSWPESSSKYSMSPHGSYSHQCGSAASTSSTNWNSGASRSSHTSKKNSRFEKYMSIQEVQKGMKKGELIEGILRINPKNYNDSYISAPDKQMDIYIGGMCDRNRALNGDRVVVKLRPPSEWKIFRKEKEAKRTLIADLKDKKPKNKIISEKEANGKLKESDTNISNDSKGPINEDISSWIEGSGDRPEGPDVIKILEADKIHQDLCDAIASKSRKKPRKRKSKKKKSASDETEDLDTTPVPESLSSSSKQSVQGSNISDAWTESSDQHHLDLIVTPLDLLDNRSFENVVHSEIKNNPQLDGNLLPNLSKLKKIEEASDEAELNDSSPVNVPLEDFEDDDLSYASSDNSIYSNDSLMDQKVLLNNELDPEIDDNNNDDDLPEPAIVEPALPQETESNDSIIVQVEPKAPKNDINDQELLTDLGSGLESIPNEINAGLQEPLKPTETEYSCKDGKENLDDIIQRINNRLNNLEVAKPEKMHTDEEVLELYNKSENVKLVQRTGKVVFVYPNAHTISGHLKIIKSNKNFVAFVPKDNRYPQLYLRVGDVPKKFLERPEDFKSTLFLASLKKWEEEDAFPLGQFHHILGEEGDIDTETEAILVENRVYHHNEEFKDECLEGLPITEEQWKIPKREIKRRHDFRKLCIFTIDPSTARDLDDALSCEVLNNGNFRIGVHIADVTFFVKDNTPLDEEAEKRATSVYLVQKVIPMLPPILCEKLCSLNPNEDKLTFSVLWEFTPEGEIVPNENNEKSTFTRSIIRSCVKLSYDHAQELIENEDVTSLDPNQFPSIHGGFTLKDIRNNIRNLQIIALELRKKRFDDGALRLDQVKLQFDLDVVDNSPFGFSIYKQRDSHRLVEELMLLANGAVAEQIFNAFPNLSLLRNHPPPNSIQLSTVIDQCEALDIKFNGCSSKDLQDAILNSINKEESDQHNIYRQLVLTSLLSKPMQCALYFCTGLTKDKEAFHHFALNVAYYTHFTSPIRRYADIVVHRLLAASLNYRREPKLKAKRIQSIADNCNERKLDAKHVHEQSCDLFLNIFLQKLGKFADKGMVCGVLDQSFDVLILNLGITKRVYCNKLELDSANFSTYNLSPSLTLNWKNGTKQEIKIFTLVDLVITAVKNEVLKFEAVIKCPQ